MRRLIKSRLTGSCLGVRRRKEKKRKRGEKEERRKKTRSDMPPHTRLSRGTLGRLVMKGRRKRRRFVNEKTR